MCTINQTLWLGYFTKWIWSKPFELTSRWVDTFIHNFHYFCLRTKQNFLKHIFRFTLSCSLRRKLGLSENIKMLFEKSVSSHVNLHHGSLLWNCFVVWFNFIDICYMHVTKPTCVRCSLEQPFLEMTSRFKISVIFKWKQQIHM